MGKPKSRPALTKAQEKEYAKVPITKEDEARLRTFIRGGNLGDIGEAVDVRYTKDGVAKSAHAVLHCLPRVGEKFVLRDGATVLPFLARSVGESRKGCATTIGADYLGSGAPEKDGEEE